MPDRIMGRAGEAEEDYIGVAWREEDGALVLQMTLPDGLRGQMMKRYRPGEEHYEMVARHLGPIPDGATVRIRPFP